MDEQSEFVKNIAGRLDSAGIPYMLTGSVALALYARPRMTRDVDVVIECRPDDVVKIVRAFGADCYVDANAVREAIASRTMFNIIHNEWVIKADFIVKKEDVYREVEFERRRRFVVEGVPVWVVALEDLVLSKLHWSRDSGSELQRSDVRLLLEAAPSLDRAYLEKWARHLGVQDLLTEVCEG